MNRHIRILLADDHTIVRQGMARLLEDQCFEPDGYRDEGTLDIECDAQDRPTRLTFTLHFDMAYGFEDC